MEIKTVELPDGNVIHLILDRVFVFLFPITELPLLVSTPGRLYRAGELTSLTKSKAFEENIHYTVHRKGDAAVFKNIKPGTRYLTHLGFLLLCSSISTPKSMELTKWASRLTYEKLAGGGEINRLFRSILMDINKIQSPDIRHGMRNKMAQLEKLVF